MSIEARVILIERYLISKACLYIGVIYHVVISHDRVIHDGGRIYRESVSRATLFQ